MATSAKNTELSYSNTQIISILTKSMREYTAPALLTPLFVVVQVAFECSIPFYTAFLIDTIKQGANLQTIMYMGGILACISLVSLAFGMLAGYTSSYAACGLAKNLRHDIFKSTLHFSFSIIDKFSSSSLVTRLTTDVMNVQFAGIQILTIAIRAPIVICAALVASVLMVGWSAWVYVGISLIMCLGLALVIYFGVRIFRRVFPKYDRLNQIIEENILGIRVVKSFTREDHEAKKFSFAADDLFCDYTQGARLMSLNAPLMSMASYTMFTLVLFFGSYAIISTRGTSLDIGQLSALITYGFQILIGLLMLSFVFIAIVISEESALRICEVLQQQNNITNPPTPIMHVPDGSISFRNVSFRYTPTSRHRALKNVSVDIHSGETVGILGMTGSAKTTLIQLIARMYDATEGEVLVGGHNVREYDIASLRKNIGYVLQKSLLFRGTIKDNLRWGNPLADDQEIMTACKASCADEFIQTLPHGLESFVEQGGSNFSGGQKQRLSIARALIKRPKILIFDDSTSAVDTKTDAHIRAELARLLPATTKIIIAQRTSSLRGADKIIVMEKGEILAVGTHSTLMQECEFYRETHLSQTHESYEEAINNA